MANRAGATSLSPLHIAWLNSLVTVPSALLVSDVEELRDGTTVCDVLNALQVRLRGCRRLEAKLAVFGAGVRARSPARALSRTPAPLWRCLPFRAQNKWRTVSPQTPAVEIDDLDAGLQVSRAGGGTPCDTGEGCSCRPHDRHAVAPP